MSSRVLRAGTGLGAVAAVVFVGVAGVMAQPAAAEGGTSMVSVLHAVPGLDVDVYANGKELLPDFKPGTLTAPLQLPAGTYDIKIFKSGASATGTPAIEKKVPVPAGVNATLVAHLTADGTPTLDAFVNDVSKVPAGQARLTVRHVAAAPAVDVRAGGKPVFKDLTNPGEAKAVVPAGTVNADVVLAGTSTVAIGPADLNLAEGTNTVVYAWGSAADKSLALKTQTLTGLWSTPGVPAGENGAALSSGGVNDAALWLFGAGSLAMVVAGAAVWRLRSASSVR